jgi:hypothetical protein
MKSNYCHHKFKLWKNSLLWKILDLLSSILRWQRIHVSFKLSKLKNIVKFSLEPPNISKNKIVEYFELLEYKKPTI